MVPCRVLHRAVVFRGVVSLSSVDYVYVLAGAQGRSSILGRGGNKQPIHTSLVHDSYEHIRKAKGTQE